MRDRLFRRALVLLFSGALTVYAFGQGGTGKARLTGTVTDKEGHSIPEAVISLRFAQSVDTRGGQLLPGQIAKRDTAAFETTADKKGRWTYYGLATGIWEVTASAPGYYPATFEVSVFQLQKNASIPFKLEKKAEPAKEDPGGADFLEKANDLFALKKYGEAIPLYRKCLVFRPDLDMVALNIGACLHGLGEFDAAIAHYEALAAKTSKDPLNAYLTAQAYAGIAECWWKKNDAGKARTFFRLALETKEGSEIWAFNWGEICFSQGAMDEAIGAYGIALRVAPGWSDPEYKIALAYLNKKDRDKAKTHFTRFLVLEPRTKRAGEVKKVLAEMDEK